jgi:hypothetical protein
LKKRIQGELYFCAGLHFLNIAAVYGRGPLTLTAFAGEGSHPNCAEQPRLYEQARKETFDEAIKRPSALLTVN